MLETTHNNMKNDRQVPVTYWMDFKTKYPNSRLKQWQICVDDLYGDTNAVCVGHDFCTECWGRIKQNKTRRSNVQWEN